MKFFKSKALAYPIEIPLPKYAIGEIVETVGGTIDAIDGVRIEIFDGATVFYSFKQEQSGFWTNENKIKRILVYVGEPRGGE